MTVANKSICLSLFILLLFSVTGCVTGPTLYTSAQNTPIAHPENKILFVDLLENGKPSVKKEVKLRNGYELEYSKPYSNMSTAKFAKKIAFSNVSTNNQIPYEDTIQKGDKFSIILNAVWIPELPLHFYQSGKDIAVIVDIIAEDGETKPLVVSYQRDVRGKHLLNFKNIVVYNTENWDGIHQPYFHLRLLDVTSERNKNTQEMLDAAASSVNSLVGLVPSAYFPHISQAIKTSKYILGGKKNEILLDYKIQFFNLAGVDAKYNETGSVNQVLDRFAQGNWIALGRPKDNGPKFWDADFSYNRKTSEISRTNCYKYDIDCNSSIDVPYVSMVVIKKNYGINDRILKSFNQMAQIILSGEVENSEGIKQVSDSLKKYADELDKSVKVTQSALSIAEGNYKVDTLTDAVSAYITSTDYEYKRFLNQTVYNTYHVPIESLINQDKTPNVQRIQSAVKALDDSIKQNTNILKYYR